jgi:hypothetical protein
MTLTTEDLARLKEIAEKATPGPYINDSIEGAVWAGGNVAIMFDYSCDMDDEQSSVDADYIAALSPDVVLSLVSELLRAWEEIAKRQWQPATTAPLNTSVLACYDNGDGSLSGVHVAEQYEAGEWRNEEGFGTGVTWWMPLPEKPDV